MNNKMKKNGFKVIIILVSICLIVACLVMHSVGQQETKYTLAEILKFMQDEEVVFGLGYPYTDDGVGGAPRFMEMMLQKLLNDMEYQKVTKVPETEPVSDIIFYLNDEEKAKLWTLCTLKAYGEGVFLEYVGGAVKYEEDKIKAVVEAMPYVAPIIANNMIVPELEEIIVSMNVVFGINEKGILSDEIVQERISQSSKDKWFVLEESLHDELLHSLAQAEKGELFVGKIKGESVYCCFFEITTLYKKKFLIMSLCMFILVS